MTQIGDTGCLRRLRTHSRETNVNMDGLQVLTEFLYSQIGDIVTFCHSHKTSHTDNFILKTVGKIGAIHCHFVIINK